MVKKNNDIISQEELDNLLMLNDFIDKKDEKSLAKELKRAILDSGKLELTQWLGLREQLLEIEELIPHIDLIIKLKKESN